MKNYHKRIELAKTRRTLEKIAGDLCAKGGDYEELDNLLALKAAGFLENKGQLFDFCRLLGYTTSQNLLIKSYFEAEEHKINNIEDYEKLLELVEIKTAFGVEARKTLDKAAEPALQVTEETSLENLIFIAGNLATGGDYDEERRDREDEIIAALLPHVSESPRSAVRIARVFPTRTFRNKFLLAYVKKYGVADEDDAEILYRDIDTDKYFGCYLKEAIVEAAKASGFDFDPDVAAMKRRGREKIAALLPMLMSILYPDFGRRPSRGFLPDFLGIDMGEEKCATCPDREHCPLLVADMAEPGIPGIIIGDMTLETHISPSPLKGSGIFPGGRNRDLLGGILSAISMIGRAPSRESFHSRHTLFPLSGGLTAEAREVYLADMPPEELDETLASVFRSRDVGDLRENFVMFGPQALMTKFKRHAAEDPRKIVFLLGPGELMSVADILASEETCARIGPERVAVLQKYVDLNKPLQRD